jgi:ubiquinone/menaquinone biosynthesis C-methylase UbiE
MPISKGFVDQEYLQLVAQTVARYKQSSYNYMRLQNGDTVLDVGCGPGTDTIPMAQIVGRGGHVFGIDYDEEMVAKAVAAAEQAGVNTFVEHKKGDAFSLPFESNCFDACRSERLFQHLSDPGKAFAEILRVTKIDGWVVVLDTDWSTLSIDTAEVDLEQRFKNFRIAQFHQNGYSGRQLYRLFKQQNLSEISVEIYPIFVTNPTLARQIAVLDEVEQNALSKGIISEAELNRWQMVFKSDATFFGSLNLVQVSGRKA